MRSSSSDDVSASVRFDFIRPNTEVGPCASSLQNASPSESSASCGTTLFTKPSASARSASMISPVK